MYVLLHHIDFGLRVYRSDSDAMIGLESTVQGWLDSMLAVMAEVWRVLRDDGVLWVNLGDSYGGGSGGSNTNSAKQKSNAGTAIEPWRGDQPGQLLMIPARFALAMQDAGWILRSDVIWAKKSCMPESLNGTRWERCRVQTKQGGRSNSQGQNAGLVEWVGSNGRNPDLQAQYTDCPGCPKCADTDGLVLRNGSWRCTSSHEHIFQFVKSMGYYSDGEAVKVAGILGRKMNAGTPFVSGDENKDGHRSGFNTRAGTYYDNSFGANRRNVWNDISPEPYGGEHYATFPSDLPRICIQTSTSEAGVCAECGSQWARVVEKSQSPHDGATASGYETGMAANRVAFARQAARERGDEYSSETKTLSWRPTCQCQAAKVPATVLDCFAGTGTTLLAAMRLGRRSVGTDLSADYLQQAVKRLSGQNMPMEF